MIILIIIIEIWFCGFVKKNIVGKNLLNFFFMFKRNERKLMWLNVIYGMNYYCK